MTLNGNWSVESGEDRTEDYRTWRTQLGWGAVCDVDQIEYDGCSGEAWALIELCVADPMSAEHPGGVRPGLAPAARFFEACEAKIHQRAQGRALRWLARQCDLPILFVVYVRGCLERGVWMKRDGSSEPWCALTLDGYVTALQRVRFETRDRRCGWRMSS